MTGGAVSEWREVVLGDVLRIKHGYAFKGEYFVSAGTDVLLTPKNFRAEGGLDVLPQRCRYYDGPIDESFVLTPGDVVVAMTDLKQDAPILGAAGTVPAIGRYLHNQRIGKVVVREPGRLDPTFAPWLLNSPSVRGRIRQTATGSTVRHSAPVRIEEVTVMLPAPQIQRRIAAILSVFDKLIEINERRIELLEDLARSLYREWFVRLRFPGHQTAGSVRPEAESVPTGWKVRPASDLFQVNPRIRSAQSVFPKVTMADVDERISAVLPSAVATRIAGSKFQRDDILFARITPCLENGKTALVKFLEPGEVAVGSTEFIVLRGTTVGPAFVYCAARSERIREHAIKSMSGSSGRQRVATSCFDSLELVEPPRVIADRFERLVEPMFEEVFELANYIRRLAATRDLLLPRLVTGQLDISDIDLGDLLPSEAA